MHLFTAIKNKNFIWPWLEPPGSGDLVTPPVLEKPFHRKGAKNAPRKTPRHRSVMLYCDTCVNVMMMQYCDQGLTNVSGMTDDEKERYRHPRKSPQTLLGLILTCSQQNKPSAAVIMENRHHQQKLPQNCLVQLDGCKIGIRMSSGFFSTNPRTLSCGQWSQLALPAGPSRNFYFSNYYGTRAQFSLDFLPQLSSTSSWRKTKRKKWDTTVTEWNLYLQLFPKDDHLN